MAEYGNRVFTFSRTWDRPIRAAYSKFAAIVAHTFRFASSKSAVVPQLAERATASSISCRASG